MVGNRGKSPLRLRIEVLEPRSLMAVLGVAPDLLPSNPNGSSDMSGDGFPGQMSAVAAASAFGSQPAPGFTQQPGTAVVLVGGDNVLVASASSAPAATTGVGQMTITTGANTPGMGSFATSTLGFSSEVGGRS